MATIKAPAAGSYAVDISKTGESRSIGSIPAFWCCKSLAKKLILANELQPIGRTLTIVRIIDRYERFYRTARC
jgi:hypothetical protein